MTETIAPPANESMRAMQYIYRLNNALRSALAPGELLWPLSMPPRLPKDKTTLTIAKAGPKKEAYFKELVKRYGWEVGIPCGVHINISLNQHLIDLVLTHMGDQFQSPAEVRNYIYTNLAQGFARYRWLFTYLFGASPVAEANFYPDDQAPQHPMRSLRQSGNGLGSQFRGDYTSPAAYANAIIKAAKTGTIINENAFHGPVRYKGGSSLDKLAEEGVDYIELRMLDLDPTTPVGIRTGTMRFIRLMASYFIMHPGLAADEVNDVLAQADRINAEIAAEDPRSHSKYEERALGVLQALTRYANQLQLGPEYVEVLQDLEDRIVNPQMTPSAMLLQYVEDGSLTNYALRQARRYQQAAQQSLRPIKEFAEGRILSEAELKTILEADH